VFVATNEYQISSSAVPAHPGNDWVENWVDWAVSEVVQVEPALTPNATAPQILSFAGGGGGVPTQIEKLLVVPTVAVVV
jgi:hypothetical protein